MIIHSEQDITNNRNTIGIYRFYNKINNKSYIGQSMKIGKRIREHMCALNNTERQYSVHKAILKYGIENFEIEILATFDMCENIHKILNTAEQIFISFYDSFKNGYNETAGGDSMTRRKWTEEQRSHMRMLMTGRKRSYENIDPRSKRIYLYNIKSHKYFEIPCAKFATSIDNSLNPKQIQFCASGRHFSTRGYICAYSKENLEHKIQNIKLEKYAN